MNDLTILHLSDLHIDGSSTSYSRLLGQLILDIKSEVKHIKENSLLLVVTGDIIHQGPLYSKNPNAFNNAIKFFSLLHKVLANKVVGIYIVPGNHDKHRTDNNSFLIPAYRTMPTSTTDKNGKSQYVFNENFYKNFWKFHLETYDQKNGTGYTELTKQIYTIFGMSETDIETKPFITDTFGVDIIKVLGRKYCFIMLNTAWSCIDDTDNRNMLLGNFQIQKIKEQFQHLIETSVEDERPAITFVLGHHPVGALRGEEEDYIFNEMISFDSFDANVYLCGHTHDRTVNNWVNNRHSINTFVTGIGWPENSSGSHVGNHTYSLYVFNLDANSVDVYVRSTNDGGSFFPDFRIYTSKQDVERKKLVFPIKAQDSKQTWRIVPEGEYVELGFAASFNNIDIDIGETKSASINKSPNRASWASYTDFNYTITSGGEYVLYDANTHKFTGLTPGVATISAVHKVTGIINVFNIEIYRSLETFLNNISDLYDVAMLYNPSSQDAILLTLQFMRREKYNGGNWVTVAGEIDDQFVAYVQTNYPNIYDTFTVGKDEDYLFKDPSQMGEIDAPHLCATLNGLLYDSTGFKSAVAGEANVDNLCGWAGDLQTLCIDVLDYTNNSNEFDTIYDATLFLLGHQNSSVTSFSMSDLLADVDAYNIYNLLCSNETNLSSVFNYYYSTGYNTRFTDFTNSWTKPQIYNCVRRYTTNIFFMFVDWPLLEGYTISTTQSDAIATAFTDYIWELIQNESN